MRNERDRRPRRLRETRKTWLTLTAMFLFRSFVHARWFCILHLLEDRQGEGGCICPDHGKTWSWGMYYVELYIILEFQTFYYVMKHVAMVFCYFQNIAKSTSDPWKEIWTKSKRTVVFRQETVPCWFTNSNTPELKSDSCGHSNVWRKDFLKVIFCWNKNVLNRWLVIGNRFNLEIEFRRNKE